MKNIATALHEIDQITGCHLVRQSPVFQTEPQEKKNQDWFYNVTAMALVEESFTPGEFLAKLQTIEKKLGRNRGNEIRFGPRTIDIDIILFGELTSCDEFCTLPHPSACRRAFVLLPLLTVMPCLKINGQGLFYWMGRLNWRLSGWRIWQN